MLQVFVSCVQRATCTTRYHTAYVPHVCASRHSLLPGRVIAMCALWHKERKEGKNGNGETEYYLYDHRKRGFHSSFSACLSDLLGRYETLRWKNARDRSGQNALLTLSPPRLPSLRARVVGSLESAKVSSAQIWYLLLRAKTTSH